MEILDMLTWASRYNTICGYAQARNWNDVFNTTTQCLITECLLRQTKNMLRNQYYRW